MSVTHLHEHRLAQAAAQAPEKNPATTAMIDAGHPDKRDAARFLVEVVDSIAQQKSLCGSICASISSVSIADQVFCRGGMSLQPARHANMEFTPAGVRRDTVLTISRAVLRKVLAELDAGRIQNALIQTETALHEAIKDNFLRSARMDGDIDDADIANIESMPPSVMVACLENIMPTTARVITLPTLTRAG